MRALVLPFSLIQYHIKDLEENPAIDVIISNSLDYAPKSGNERNDLSFTEIKWRLNT